MNRHLSKLLGTLAAMALIVQGNIASGQDWVFTNGPRRPHAIKDLSASKVGSTQTIYAADPETVKYSTNGGVTWLSTGQILIGAQVISSQPDNASNVHAATPGHLFMSANGGSLWTEKLYDEKIVPLRLAESVNSPDVWLLGTDTVLRSGTWTTSLYRTSNAGSNWSGVGYFSTNAHTNVNDVVSHPSVNKIFTGGSRKPKDQTPDMTDEGSSPSLPTKGVWYSSDGGVNWTFCAGQMGDGTHGETGDRNVTAMAYSINGSNELLFAATTKYSGGTTKATLFQATDEGGNWSVTKDLYAAVGVGLVKAIKVSPTSYNTLVAATDKGFAISTNRGTDWSLGSGGLENLFNANQVLFDMNTSNTTYLGSDETFYYSTDVGQNWSGDRGILNQINSSGLAINSSNAQSVSSSYGFIGRASSFGAWSPTPQFVGQGTFTGQGQGAFTGQAVAINSTNTQYANAVGDSAGQAVIYVRSNGADGWRKVFTSDAGSHSTPFYTVVADGRSNSQRVYAGGTFLSGGSGYNFIRSTDLGVDWAGQFLIGGTVNVPVLSMGVDVSSGSTYSTVLYAGLGHDVGSGQGIRKSSDGGASWGAGAQLNGYDVGAIAVASWSVLYMASTDHVWRSDDALGSVPTQVSGSFGAKAILMHPSYSGTAHAWLITPDGQTIYKTTNSGANWTEVSTTGLAANKPLTDLKGDPTGNQLIWVASSGGVYKVDPAPETPTGLASGGSTNPILSWNANGELDLSGSGAYQLFRKIGDDDWQSLATLGSGTLSDTDKTVTLAQTGTQVQYRIRAGDAMGHTSDYTTSVSVQASNISPGTPTLASPANGATQVSTTPTLTWNAVANATSYRLQVSLSSDFSSTVFDQSGITSTSKQVTSGLVHDETYYWHVNATWTYGTGPYSDTWHFDTQTPPPPPCPCCPPDEGPGIGGDGLDGGPCKTSAESPAVEEGHPKDFSLGQNYPNPFNPVTLIKYGLPVDEYVTLKVYNALGQIVANLVDGMESAGFKSVEFNAARLPSGIYFYRLQAGSFTEIRKMALMK